jgi:hypothetical protein
MSRYSDGITACPENCIISLTSVEVRGGGVDERTPLMKSPKLRGSLAHLGLQAVGIGICRLPGLTLLMDPSAMRTQRRVKEERMPRRDVMERNRRGRNVVGTMLRAIGSEGVPAGGYVAHIM